MHSLPVICTTTILYISDQSLLQQVQLVTVHVLLRKLLNQQLHGPDVLGHVMFPYHGPPQTNLAVEMSRCLVQGDNLLPATLLTCVELLCSWQCNHVQYSS